MIPTTIALHEKLRHGSSSRSSSIRMCIKRRKRLWEGVWIVLSLSLVLLITQPTQLRQLKQSTSYRYGTIINSVIQQQQQVRTTPSNAKLPDWRLAMDCSVWDFHCVTTKLSSGRYEPYPFPYTRRYDHDHLFNWEPLDEVPLEWQAPLVDNDLAFVPHQPPPRPIEYSYKPQASASALQACLERAQTKSWNEQLVSLIYNKKIRPDPDTNLLAFTISDYNYAKDMMHEIFEMNDAVVGFESAFFMVAIDYETLELACRYEYPVIAWPTAVPEAQQNTTSTNSTTAPKEDLKHSVANTKFEVSLALVELNQSFFFYEMDVWFLQSPKPILKLFEGDILFSSHQNCPMCVNIGVYMIKANQATREYFQKAIQLAHDSPNTHDQFILAQIVFMQAMGKKFEYGPRWDPIPEYIPKFRHVVKTGHFGPHEIVASERPYSSQQALAIHPLRESPLKDPHGKKILAKEMGAWYGFQGQPVGKNAQAGYFHRTGQARRYIMLDGHVLNGYSTVMNWEFDPSESGLYHSVDNMKWTVAALVALARRTGRILVLPPVAKDRGIHFLWTFLDLKSVEELGGVDYRETTFFNNPKSWVRDDTPFDTVARTALGNFKDDRTMFAQYNTDEEISTTTRAWKFNSTTMDKVAAADSWWSIHSSIPEIDAAELLLVNPHFLNMHYHRPLSGKLRKAYQDMAPDPQTGRGRADYDIASIFAKLRWCSLDHFSNVQDIIVGVFKSNDDCYGKGEYGNK